MAIRIGTIVTAPIRIEDDTIPFPVVYQEEVQGGAHSNATLANRNALALWYRQWGMTFRVYNDGVNNGNYILKYGNVDTDLSNNANWVLEVTTGGPSNLLKLDGTINGTGTLIVPANAMLYSILVVATGPITLFKAGLSAGLDDLVMGQPVPSGPNNFHKGLWCVAPTTVFFTGVTPQSVCSVIYFQF